MRTVLITLLAVVLIGAGAAYAFIHSGTYNVAATDEHLSSVESILNTLKVKSIRAHASEVSIELPTDSAALRRGHRAFDEMCAPCHGAPGKERGWMGKGMNPQPPELDHSAEEYSSEEIFWIVSNGIKLAGMPALAPTHDRAAMLEITAFVDQLPETSEEEYAAWSRADSTTEHAGHAGHEH